MSMPKPTGVPGFYANPMTQDMAVKLLSDYCDRGMVTLGHDFQEAVRIGKAAIIRERQSGGVNHALPLQR